jgi:hypothetical protein
VGYPQPLALFLPLYTLNRLGIELNKVALDPALMLAFSCLVGLLMLTAKIDERTNICFCDAALQELALVSVKSDTIPLRYTFSVCI